MKKLFIILLVLTGFGARSQNIHVPPPFTATQQGSVPAPGTVTGRFLGDNQNWNAITAVIPTVALGTLYSKSSFSSTSDFTTAGTITIGASGGQLNISGGAYQYVSDTIGKTTLVNQNAKITAYGGTMLERWSYLLGGKVGSTPSATTGGIAIGQLSTNTHSLSSVMAYFNLSTNNGQGRIYILGTATNQTLAVSPDSISINNGDSVVITMERIQDIFYASARDVTTGSAQVVCSYQYDVTSSSNPLTPNTGVFDICTFGGNFSVDTINITSLERKQPNILLFGDSKMRYAMGWDCSVTAQLNRWFTNTINCSGEGDATADMLNHLQEVINIQPSTVILEAGRNDLGYGVSTGVWQANIDTMVARMQRAGITVWLVDAIYETFISQATLISFIQTTFPNNYIATNAAGQAVGAATVCSDQVHPTFLGAQIVAQVIKDRMVISNNAKYVDGINDGTRLYGLSVQNINNYGYIRDPAATYTPAYNPHDIVVADGTAITGAYGSSAQSASFVISKTGTAASVLTNNLGGGEQAGGGFTVITPTGSATGTQNQAFRISNAGTAYIGAPAIPSTLTSTSTGWLLMAIGKGIMGSNTNGTGIHGGFIPFSGTNFTEIRNYWSGGGITGYVSGGTADAQVLSFEAAPSANFLVGGLTVDSTAWLQVAAGTSTNAQIYLKPGTIMTTPKNGSLTHVNGHLWFTDQGTNYDLLASGGGSFTCTPSNTTNVSAAAITDETYSVSNQVVTVTIGGTVTVTTGLLNSEITLTLPIATTQTGAHNYGPAMVVNASASPNQYAPGIIQLASSTTVGLFFVAPTTAGSSIIFTSTFQYHL